MGNIEAIAVYSHSHLICSIYMKRCFVDVEFEISLIPNLAYFHVFETITPSHQPVALTATYIKSRTGSEKFPLIRNIKMASSPSDTAIKRHNRHSSGNKRKLSRLIFIAHVLHLTSLLQNHKSLQ